MNDRFHVYPDGLRRTIQQAYKTAVGHHANGVEIVEQIAVAIEGHHSAKALRDQAVEKCRSCKHGAYRPYTPGRSARHVAYDVEAIRCDEGVYALRGPGRWPKQRPYGFKPESVGWYWTGFLARADSKVRERILTCGFWEAKT